MMGPSWLQYRSEVAAQSGVEQPKNERPRREPRLRKALQRLYLSLASYSQALQRLYLSLLPYSQARPVTGSGVAASKRPLDKSHIRSPLRTFIDAALVVSAALLLLNVATAPPRNWTYSQRASPSSGLGSGGEQTGGSSLLAFLGATWQKGSGAFRRGDVGHAYTDLEFLGGESSHDPVAAGLHRTSRKEDRDSSGQAQSQPQLRSLLMNIHSRLVKIPSSLVKIPSTLVKIPSSKQSTQEAAQPQGAAYTDLEFLGGRPLEQPRALGETPTPSEKVTPREPKSPERGLGGEKQEKESGPSQVQTLFQQIHSEVVAGAQGGSSQAQGGAYTDLEFLGDTHSPSAKSKTGVRSPETGGKQQKAESEPSQVQTLFQKIHSEVVAGAQGQSSQVQGGAYTDLEFLGEGAEVQGPEKKRALSSGGLHSGGEGREGAKASGTGSGDRIGQPFRLPSIPRQILGLVEERDSSGSREKETKHEEAGKKGQAAVGEQREGNGELVRGSGGGVEEAPGLVKVAGEAYARSEAPKEPLLQEGKTLRKAPWGFLKRVVGRILGEVQPRSAVPLLEAEDKLPETEGALVSSTGTLGVESTPRDSAIAHTVDDAGVSSREASVDRDTASAEFVRRYGGVSSGGGVARAWVTSSLQKLSWQAQEQRGGVKSADNSKAAALRMRDLLEASFFEPNERLALLQHGAVDDRDGSAKVGQGVGEERKSGERTASRSPNGEGQAKAELICLAIPSVPRGNSGKYTAAAAEELLRALSARRLVSKPVRYSLHAVVYSAGCPGADAGKGCQHEEEGCRGEEDRVLLDHEEALKRALFGARNLNATVIRPHESLCRLMKDPEKLLEVIPKGQMQGHWLWRTKETMDFTYVMRQCLALQPKYVLFLEDDTWPVKGYDYGIQHLIDVDLAGKDWHAVSLYFPSTNAWRHRHLKTQYNFPCCTQAILMPAGEAEHLVGFVEERFAKKPVDWLIRDYIDGNNRTSLVHIPSLFQHQVTIPSSNKWRASGGRQHKDTAFSETWVARKYYVKV